MSHEIIAIINKHKFGGPATFTKNIIRISRGEILKFVILKNLKIFFKCNYCLVINFTKNIHILILCKIFNKKLIYRLGAPFFFHNYGKISILLNIKRRILNLFIIVSAIFFSNKIIFQTKYCYNTWILEHPFLKKFLKRKKISFILNGAFKTNSDFKKKNFKKFYFFSFEWSVGFKELLYLNQISKQFKTLCYVYGNIDSKIQTNEFKNLRFKKIKKRESVIKEAQKSKKIPILLACDFNPACSNAITEALINNIPVVAPSLGGNKEILGDKYKLVIKIPQKIFHTNSSFQNWINGEQFQIEVKNIIRSLKEKKSFSKIIQQNYLLQKKLHIKNMYKNYVNFIRK